MAADLLTVIIASVSCVAFCLLVLILAVVLRTKERFCCTFMSCTEERHSDDPPQYHSRHTLMVPDQDQSSAALNQADTNGSQLPGRLFIIGKPNHYHMEGMVPRLPSYESVRRKDRQRQIHSMIAQRFGLNGCRDEPPPSYEESLRHSLQSVDLHTSPHSQDRLSNLS